MKTLLTAFAFASVLASVLAEEAPVQSSPSKEQPALVFKISLPADGQYAPNQSDDEIYYAGETITIKDQTFRFLTFTDIANAEGADFKGKVQVFEDHVFLDHPGVMYPYRIAGTLDGRPVLLTWIAYQSWKKSGQIPFGILYLQKDIVNHDVDPDLLPPP
jgi:hypothetical protein